MKNKEQFKQLKQLAKEAYNSKEVSQEWKDKILEVCPDLKKHKEGWYKCTKNSHWMAYFDGERYLYGVDGYGVWTENFEGIISTIKKYDKLATEEEVKEALIKEAKRRGYRFGDIVNREGMIVLLKEIELNEFCDSEFKGYKYTKDCLYFYGTKVFESGKWAKIIQEPEEIEVEHEEVKPDIIELNGKKYKLIPID